MIVADTNLFIYLAKGVLQPEVFGDEDVAYASVSRVEGLGFQLITAAEAQLLEMAFMAREQIDLTNAVVLEAIRLRQLRKMSLGDAIIAATARIEGAELWTANEADFAGIDGLRVRTPLSGTMRS